MCKSISWREASRPDLNLTSSSPSLKQPRESGGTVASLSPAAAVKESYSGGHASHQCSHQKLHLELDFESESAVTFEINLDSNLNLGIEYWVLGLRGSRLQYKSRPSCWKIEFEQEVESVGGCRSRRWPIWWARCWAMSPSTLLLPAWESLPFKPPSTQVSQIWKAYCKFVATSWLPEYHVCVACCIFKLVPALVKPHMPLESSTRLAWMNAL